jgi:hypothetical protein
MASADRDAARKLLDLAPSAAKQRSDTETFETGCHPRHRPTAPLVVIRIDTP